MQIVLFYFYDVQIHALSSGTLPYKTLDLCTHHIVTNQCNFTETLSNSHH